MPVREKETKNIIALWFYLLQFSTILFLILHPSALLLPVLPLLLLLPFLLPFCPHSTTLLPSLFPSMYIFRSRVIKSAPAGMCWNRISLILPCPHGATKIQICIKACMSVTAHAHTNVPFSFFFHFSFKHRH